MPNVGMPLAALARAITGVRAIWQGSAPSDRQRIYFANHASHGDFIILSASLPSGQRTRTRPIAAADYWGKTALRRFVAETLLGAVLMNNTFRQLALSAATRKKGA